MFNSYESLTQGGAHQDEAWESLVCLFLQPPSVTGMLSLFCLLQQT